jgi:TRAP-type C4-dicarboxylate transport system permease large subunit
MGAVKTAKTSATISIILAASTLLHQYLTIHTLFQLKDIMHHETITLILLTYALTCLWCNLK